MKNANRSLILLIGLLVMVVLLASCAPAATTAPAQTTKGAPGTSGTTQPTTTAKAEPQAIEIFGSGSAIPDTDPLIPVLNKKLNIKLTYKASAEWETELGVRIAGGTIPDVFQIPFKNLAKYAQDGVLLNIGDYKDKLPNVLKVTRQADWNKVTVDGKISAIPKRPEDYFCSWWIRYDWLTKLNAKMPTSLDELYNLAVTIKNADLDGNGKSDTYPLSGSIKEGRSSAFNGFFTAYGVAGPNNLMLVDKKVVLASTQPHFKEAIEAIRKFVQAGLVDPEIMANDNNAVTEKMAAGKTAIVYSGWHIHGRQTAQTALSAVDPKAKWGHMDAITGPYGTTGAAYDMAGGGLILGINADLTDNKAKLAKIFELFEYCSTTEGEDLVCYGVEGTHYKVENGKKVKLDAMNNLGYAWQLQMTGRDNMTYCMVKFAECASEVQYAAKDVKLVYAYENLIIPPADINLADIKAYETEQVMAFIFGRRDLKEYDAFVSTLKSTYKLDTYLASAQKQLDASGYTK